MGHLAAVVADQADRQQAARPRLTQATQDVLGVAAGGDADQYVIRPAKGDDLPQEHILKGDVVGDRGHHGDVVGQR